MRRNLFFLQLLFFNAICFSQNALINDSLQFLNKDEIQVTPIKYQNYFDSIINNNLKGLGLAYRTSGFVDILQLKFESANEKIKKAINIDSINNNHLGLAEDYNIFARYYKDNKENDKALFYFKKASLLSQKYENDNTGKHLYDLAAFYNLLKNSNSAIVTIKLAQEHFEKVNDSFYLLKVQKLEASLFEKKPWNMDIFLKEYKLAKRRNNAFLIAGAQYQIGTAFTSNRSDNGQGQAIKYLDSAITFFEKTNNHYFLNMLYTSRAFRSSQFGDRKYAIELYKKQYEMLRNTKHFMKETSLYNLANQYYKIGKYNKAEIIFNEILTLSNSSEIQPLLIELSHKGLSEIYENRGQYAKAFYSYKEYKKIGDDQYSLRVADQVNKYKISFETEKKEKENLILIKEKAEQALVLEKESQRKWIFGTLAILGVFSVLIVLVYSKNRRQKLLYKSQLDVAKAKQMEHQRIATDLHDHKVKSLEAIKIELQKEGKITLSNKVETIKESLRHLSKELSQISFDESEFEEQIITLMASYHTDNIKLQEEGLRSIKWKNINNTIKQNLFLVIREGISNAYNHSQAKIVTLKFQKKNEQLIIIIKDDGKGFEQSTPGIGFTNMKMRINEINGNIKIEGEKGSGTEIGIYLALV